MHPVWSRYKFDMIDSPGHRSEGAFGISHARKGMD
jgi:hypothetical protein